MRFGRRLRSASSRSCGRQGRAELERHPGGALCAEREAAGRRAAWRRLAAGCRASGRLVAARTTTCSEPVPTPSIWTRNSVLSRRLRAAGRRAEAGRGASGMLSIPRNAEWHSCCTRVAVFPHTWPHVPGPTVQRGPSRSRPEKSQMAPCPPVQGNQLRSPQVAQSVTPDVTSHCARGAPLPRRELEPSSRPRPATGGTRIRMRFQSWADHRVLRARGNAGTARL